MVDRLSEESVFRVAFALASPELREEYLRQVSAGNEALYQRVTALLQVGQERPDFLESPPPGVAATMDRLPIGIATSSHIGPYQLLEKIGEGGMGVVYVAEQTQPVRRKVALKIIKPGLDSREIVARFEAERQALALMDHPSIAKVLDAGTIPSEGDRPYFVMELVQGTPITNFSDRQQLTIHDRLELFASVCQAVQHAHQKGVIHRDLKPGNVLVEMHDDRPVPKIIDFGVAKAMGQKRTNESLHTRFDQMVGTPLYMSPEQAGQSSLDIDTRSDIYSLGVVLYELLTGHTPFAGETLRSVDFEELRRIIRETEPPRPSVRVSTLPAAGLSTISASRQIEPHKLSMQLRGDLDWIVVKALEKDRERRYQSSNALAEDLERYLRDEPVLAGPPSAAYRLRKFARRNKRALLTTAAVALVVLLGVGVLGGSVGYIVRERAVRRSETERAVESALAEARTLEQQSKWSAALEATRRAQVVADSQAAGDELRAQVERLIRDLSIVVRLEEIRLETSAVKNEEFELKLGDRLYAQAFRDYGIDVETLSAAEVAECMPDGPVRNALAAALDDWARLSRATVAPDSDPKKKDEWMRLVAAAQATDADPYRNRLREAWIKGDRTTAHALIGEVPRENLHPSQLLLTEPLLARDEYIALLRDAQGRHPADFWLNHTLGLTSIERQPLDAAEALGFYRAALAQRPESPGVLYNLANAFSKLDRYADAIAAYEQAIRLKPDYASAFASLGAELVRQGDLEKATEVFRKLVALSPQNPVAHYNLGTTLCRRGIYDSEAKTALREAIRLSPRYATAHCNLGIVLARKGELDEAEKSFRMAIWIDPNHAEVHNSLGAFLCDRRHDYDGAITAFRRAIELGINDSKVYCNLGVALLSKGDVDQAIGQFQQAIQLEPDDAKAHANLCLALLQKQSWEEAIAAAQEAIRCCPDLAEAHCTLGRALQKKGQLREALEALQRGHELGRQDPNWKYPSAQWIEECRQQLHESQSAPNEPESTSNTSPLSQFLPPLPELWRGEGGVRGSSALANNAQMVSQRYATKQLTCDPIVSMLMSLSSITRTPTHSVPFHGFLMWAFFQPRAALRLLRAVLASPRGGSWKGLAQFVTRGTNIQTQEQCPVRSKAPTTVLTGPDISPAAWSARSGRWPLWFHYSQTAPSQKEHTMSRTHHARNLSRRDLANSLGKTRSNASLRLCRRPLLLELLEERQLLASITGQVFNDLNANGLKEASESGQSGWTIYLDADGNGQLDTGETSTITAADGSYTFSDLAAGTYTVAEVQKLDWRQTSPAGTGPDIERVSVASDGTQGDGGSYSATISGNNRYVVFASVASNLVPGDTNGQQDIFVFDRQTDTTERVSVASDGTQANDVSLKPSISADGRFVAFRSRASNLVAGADTNGYADVFVYDRQAHTIERVTLAAAGTQTEGTDAAASISADGRYVAFNSNASNLVPGDTNGQQDVFVYDRQTNTTERVSVSAEGAQGNGGTRFAPAISADGRYVTFASSASNLVPGDTNGVDDVFVYDRETRSVTRVSIAFDGSQGNDNSASGLSISADGRYIGFTSNASNLVSGDTNGWGDCFVYDRQTQSVERVSVASDGTQANGFSSAPSLSADGRYVAFSSGANNLVAGDANAWMDTFVYDRQTHTTKLASVAADGTQTSGGTSSGRISADGQLVALYSTAGNIVPGDTNGVPDIFTTATPFTWTSASHLVSLTSGQSVSGINFGNTSPTKFYVVDDASQNLTYEYTAKIQLNESYSLNTGNTAPRGVASTIAGDKTWVIDANRKVYVYNNSGGLVGSWTAGTLASNATVEGIATNGTDVWIVDAKSDKVFKYTGAATRTSGTQYAASSFNLNSGNTSPKDIVTDGVYLWVVNDSTTDKVFKYTVAGSLVISWTITTPGATSPTGITIDPANVCDVWIVDSGTDRVYQYTQGALTLATYSTSSSTSFALAAGNTNPQGIADPPAPGTYLVTETPVLTEPVTAEATLRNNDVALADMYDQPLKKIRIDTARRRESRFVESHTRDLGYTVGAAPNCLADNSLWVSENDRQSDVDDLFAEWDSDPLALLRLADLGM